MLYTIFLYESDSGQLMYDKNFQNISSGKMELFSSFFAALKTFISQMVLDGSNELKSIEMGDYSVLITTISDIKSQMVIIGDKEDYKFINKLIPDFIKVLIDNKQIFVDWKEKQNNFDVLDQPFSGLVLSHKRLTGDTSLVDKASEILKSIWAHKVELTEEEKAKLIEERKTLIAELEKEFNLLKKVSINEKLLEIAEKLKDDQEFLKIQPQIRDLRKGIKDSKMKASYYLEKTKHALAQAIRILGYEALRKGDFKDVYLNLYSFSSKLKFLTEDDKWNFYRELANYLIKKDDLTDEELSKIISFILKMNDDIEEYFN